MVAFPGIDAGHSAIEAFARAELEHAPRARATELSHRPGRNLEHALAAHNPVVAVLGKRFLVEDGACLRDQLIVECNLGQRLLQHRIGANGCAAFDVNAACSGFIYALTVADKFIRSGTVKTALVVGAETLTRMLDWSDRSTCVLFGDGAGAVVLKASEEVGILSTHMHADGAYKELLWNPVGVSVGFTHENNHGVRVVMQGSEVFKVAVKTLDRVVEETLAHNGLDRHAIDWLIPHQANLRIIQATAKRLDMPMDRVIVTVDKHGNTSSGSVPLALDHGVRSGRIERGQLLLLEAFGGGFTWGSALVRY